jgi:hypothetical protein
VLRIPLTGTGQQGTISEVRSGHTIRGEVCAAPAVPAIAAVQIAVAAARSKNGAIRRRIANTTGGETTRKA